MQQNKANRREFIAAASSLALAARAGPAGAQDGGAGQVNSRELIGAALAGPDYALVNGSFIDHRGRVGDTLTVAGDRIAAIGFALELAPELPVLDLGGRSAIPGLIDAHVHYTRAGINPGYQARRVERAFSLEELKQTIAERAASVPAGEFITCIGGWNHNQLAERRVPTAADLDDAAPAHAVYLAATGGGTGAIANTRAAAIFAARGVEVELATGRVGSSRDALAALTAAQTEADRLRGTAELNAHAASLGLTTVVNAGNLEDQTYPLALWRSGRLDLRMRPLYPADSPDEVASRAANLFAQDGRAVGDELYRPAGFGERIGGGNTMSEQFEPTALAVARAGWLLQQHSISATENAFHLAVFERIARERPIADLHWALIHLQAISAEHLAALGRLGAGASAQTWTYLSAAGGPPFRRIVDSGIPAAVGTDSTNVSALDPWLTLYYMITGRNLAGEPSNEGQQISRLEALKLYTDGAAWFCHEQDRLGAFEPGRLADLAVLSHDYLTVPEDALRRVEAQLTLVGGRVVHAAGPFGPV